MGTGIPAQSVIICGEYLGVFMVIKIKSRDSLVIDGRINEG